MRAVQEEHENDLSVVSDELKCVKDVIVGRGIDFDDHIAFNHAVYAEELVALTTADLQLHHLSCVRGRLAPDPADESGVISPSDDTHSLPETSGSEVDSSELDFYDDVKYEE